jgi:hypothetical protein
VSRIRTRAWPWFALAALLLFVGAVIVHGSARSVVESVAVFLLVAACIRALGLSVRDNPVGAEMVTRRSIEAGVAGWMAQDAADRRARRRARKRPPPDSESG